MSHTQGAGDGAGTGFFSFPPPPPYGFIDRMSDEQDKMRFQGYESSSVVAAAYPAAVYDSAGMLSEIFDFGAGRQSVTTAAPAELLGLVDQQNPNISGIHAGDSAAAAMHLFFTNPPLKSSPPYTSTALNSDQGFHAPQFTWIPEGTPAAEGQGLSLSLASSLEAAKAEELRLRTTVGGGYGGTTNSSHEMMFFNAAQESRAAAASSSSNSYQQLHFGFGTTSSSVFSLAAVNVLRNSKYTRPAQELLEEFCSVGRGNHQKKTAGGSTNSGGGGSSTKDPPSLSPADRMEHQRRKVKLATMLDEVERRYSHYCEQMQMVVNSFEMVMGFGAAVPYTALAQKAMSRHFRCLKVGIQAQLRQCCEVLGEKDLAGGMGITKGETPRLKMLEQNLRKQRAFHQMGIMEQEAWRPQRGLPERSVNILRAWLFEHFLHPYPSDADKHLLARQTGLSRNQVANWFINARVRLWKPMIEDMYQQESKDHDADDDDGGDDYEESIRRSAQTPTQLPLNSLSSTTTTLAINDNDPSLISSESAQFIHHVPNYMLRHHHQPTATGTAATSVDPTSNAHFTTTTTSYSQVEEACSSSHFGTTSTPGDSGAHHHDNVGVGPTMIRFGGTTPSATGDVSLTLGLRQGAAVAGRNPPDKTGFSFTDFGRSS